MNGATARPTSRHASRGRRGRPRSRSACRSRRRPSPPWPAPTASRRRRAGWRPRRASHSSASASWSRHASSARRVRRPGARPRPPRGARGPGRGPLAVEVAVGHRDRPVDEVAEVVREVGVVAPDERVPADTSASRSNGDLAQRDVAGAVGAERRDEVVRVEEVAAALAHPLAARGEQPAVDPDLPRRLEPGAPEHRRPEDRVEAGDVLADDVEVGRPPASRTLPDRPGSRRR